MAKVVADHDVPVIVMHNRDMIDAGIDIMQDLSAFFGRSLDIAAKAGIPQKISCSIRVSVSVKRRSKV